MARRKQSKVEGLIEAAYYRHAEGRSIDVFKIADLFRYCRERVEGGASVELAVSEAVDCFCEPVGDEGVESGCSMVIQRL